METKRISDRECQKEWINSTLLHALTLLIFTILNIVIWQYTSMGLDTKRFITAMLFVLCHRTIWVFIQLIIGLLGWTNTSVLKEGRSEKYL
jgi:hypothetical protein